MKLICLPYSGSSSSIFHSWRKNFPEHIHLVPVEYPGRGKRFSEKCSESMSELIDSIYGTVAKEIQDTTRYAVFGHSLGGLASYELVVKLLLQGHQAPEHLFVSGCTPPHLGKSGNFLHELPDDEFLTHIYQLGGMNEDLYANQEMVEFFTPIIKADYKVYELYQGCVIPRKIPVDMTVFSGDQDPLVPKESVSQWSWYSSETCQIHMYRGGHFFLHEELEDVIERVVEALTPLGLGASY